MLTSASLTSQSDNGQDVIYRKKFKFCYLNEDSATS